LCTQILFKGISSNSSLKILRLDRNNFSGQQFIENVHILVCPESPLQAVFMNECSLGENGGQAFIKGLSKNYRLKSISLQKNLLSDLFAKELSDILENTQLKFIELSQNKITVFFDFDKRKFAKDNGALEIADSIKKVKSVSYIGLASNNIGNEGGKAFLEVVTSARHVEKIFLKANNINYKIINEIDAKTNENITEMRKQKIPEYEQEIKNIVVNDDLLDEIEWKSEQIKQEKEQIESEISAEHKIFERIKSEETLKLNMLKKEYDKVLEKEKIIDLQIEEFDSASKEMLKHSESCILEANHKVKTLSSNIEQIAQNCIFQNS